MKALTVHNPYAWAIRQHAWDPAAKDIENRSWPTRPQTDVALHAGRHVDRAAFANPLVRAMLARAAAGPPPGAGYGETPWRDGLGAVIAVVDIAGVCDATTAAPKTGGTCDCGPWAIAGQYHWRLTRIRPLPAPVPCRGMQQLWPLPVYAAVDVRSQLAA